MKLKEALTGIKQQTAEIINPQKALEANKPVDNNENNKIKIQDSEFLYEKRLMGALASLTDGEFVKQFGPDCTIDDKGYIVKGDGTRTNLKPSMLDYHAEIKKNDGRNPEELRQSIKDEIEWENSSEIKTSEDKELIETVAMSNQEGSKSKVEEKEEVKSNPHEVANDIVLEPNKDKPQKIEIKELPEEWKRFDKAWFSNYVPNEYEYLDIAQKVKNFSENLADHDEVFRKMLSEKIFENEKYNSLSEFIGINEEGRLVNRNGAINNFPHMLIGFSPRRAEYEQKLVQAYAKEKGYL